MSNVKSQPRYALLDLIRYVAAMMVALMHWELEIGSEKFHEFLRIPILGFLIQNGGLGVDIFFLISGYVIIETAQKKDSLDFLIARFRRLFPGLFISMTIVLIVGSHFITPYRSPFESFINSIFLTFSATGVQPLASQLWTLVYEVKFYGAIALLLLVVPKVFKSQKKIVTLLILWQILIALLESAPFHLSVPFLSLGHYGSLFALGICINFLAKLSMDNYLTAFMVILVSVYFIGTTFFTGNYSQRQSMLLGIFAILIGISSRIALGQSTTRVARYLGLASYLIYLLHVHVGMTLLNIFQAHGSPGLAYSLIFTLVIITLLSVFLALFIEKPLQDIINKTLLRIRVRRPRLLG